MIMAVLGIALVAVPTGIISSGFIEQNSCKCEKSDIEDISLQLQMLKELFEKGLIDEEEYKHKKAQILVLI